MDGRGGVKVIDLGLGNFFDVSGEKLLNTFCGSADYAAPELWKGEKYKGPGVDIWSLGVLAFVITTGFIPFNDSSNVMAIRYHWPKSRTYSASLKDMISRIFRERDSRIQMEELLNHSWLTNDGKLPPIPRPPLKLNVTDLDKDLLEAMDVMGFPRADVEAALLHDEHNQITTTYYLMLHQKEVEARSASSKRFKPVPSHEHLSSMEESPTPEKRSPESLSHSQNTPSSDRRSGNCIIC